MFKKGNSIRDTPVLGLWRQTLLEKRILAGKALREGVIAGFLLDATQNDKKTFENAFFAMRDLAVQYLTVCDRLLVLPDSNVIIDVLKKDAERERKAKYVASLALLCLLEDYFGADLFFCMTPSVTYEMHGRKAVKNKDEGLKTIDSIIETCAEMGMRTHRIGFDEVSDLQEAINRIRHDEREISRALKEIKEKSWAMNFSLQEGEMLIPLAVAEREVPNIRLKYFDPGVIKMILMQIIEKKMYEENKNQPKARRMMNRHDKGGITKILRLESGKLFGLADVEMISFASLNSQTFNEHPYITMALTYDGALNLALMGNSDPVYDGLDFSSGDDAEIACRVDSYHWRRSSLRTKKMNKRIEEFSEAFKNFKDHVILPHLKNQTGP